MVSSVDGFISKKDDDVSWMHVSDHYEKGETLTKEDIEDLSITELYLLESFNPKNNITSKYRLHEFKKLINS